MKISKLPLNTEANTKSSQYHVEISSTPDIKFGRHLRVFKGNLLMKFTVPVKL
jgi:HlyD family secretion protein